MFVQSKIPLVQNTWS